MSSSSHKELGISLDEHDKERKHQRKSPSPKQLKRLQNKLQGTEVPVLSAEEVDAMFDSSCERLGEGTYGEAFLNPTKGIVLKYSEDYSNFLPSIKEAKYMVALRSVKGVQQLVGVCPERFALVTKYAGSTLRKWMGKGSPLVPLQFVEIAITIAKTFGGIHQSGVVHNDIKWDNLCLQFTTKGVKVTLIDFGLAKDYGMTMSLEGEWIPEGCYPPEFYKDFGGECCHESDVYAIGGLMETICKRADLQNPKILEWIRKSKSQLIEERENLNVLLKLLRAERSEVESRTR